MSLDCELPARRLEVGAGRERAAYRGRRRRSAPTSRSAGRPARWSRVHSGSSVPLTISRFSASSAVPARRRCLRHRLAARRPASACACTTSSGASVPTSTRAWLSSTSLRRQRQRPLGHVGRLNRVDQIPVGVADVGERPRDGARAASVSEICWLIWVTCSCARVPSMRKLRSSGCTNAADEVGVERRVAGREGVRLRLPVVVERRPRSCRRPTSGSA